MQNLLTLRGITLGIAVVLLTSIGCSKQPELVGRWVEADKPNPVVMEYLSDGTFIIRSGKQPSSSLLGLDQVTGTWVLLEDGRLKMNMPGLFGQSQVIISTFKYDGEQLVLSSDGKTSRFNRAQ